MGGDEGYCVVLKPWSDSVSPVRDEAELPITTAIRVFACVCKWKYLVLFRQVCKRTQCFGCYNGFFTYFASKLVRNQAIIELSVKSDPCSEWLKVLTRK